jgi:hypothetical protein
MSGAKRQGEIDIAALHGSLNKIGAEFARRTRENHRLGGRDGVSGLREIRFEVYIIARSVIRGEEDRPFSRDARGGAATSTTEKVTWTWNARGQRNNRCDRDGKHYAQSSHGSTLSFVIDIYSRPLPSRFILDIRN